MFFEWDEAKRSANFEKHGVDFDDARLIFEGPVFEKADGRKDYGEDRMIAIGVLEDVEIVVVYVMRGERRRMISARRANRHERQDYWRYLEGKAGGTD
ncbi:MAG: BrnT family toxin [Sphingomonadales bacterium]|nr:BrnT family toxin [Sphingomonadales bacterium]